MRARPFRGVIEPGMLTPARIAALSVLVSAVVLVASCIADVQDDAGNVVDDAQAIKINQINPNIPSGPCGEACVAVARGNCGNWQDECAEMYPNDENVSCGGQALSCIAAQHAATGTVVGVTYCSRDCEHLR